MTTSGTNKSADVGSLNQLYLEVTSQVTHNCDTNDWQSLKKELIKFQKG